MAVPNVLGFVEAMPKAPLSDAMKTAVNMYGTLQDIEGKKKEIEAKSEELKRSKMLTEATPEMLEQQTKKGEQEIEKGEIANKEEKLLLAAMPKEIRNKLTGQQLTNMHQQYVNETSKLDVNTAKENYIQSHMADLVDLPDDVAEKQYQVIRQKADKLGIDTSDMPKTFDKNAQITAWLANAKSPATAEQRKYDQELTKIRIEQEGKIEAAQAKNATATSDPYVKEYQQKQAQIDAKANNETIPVMAEAGRSSLQHLNVIEDEVNKHPEEFGPTRGWFTTKVSDAARDAAAEAYNVVIEKLKSIPGASRGTKALLTMAENSKINVALDSDKLIKLKINRLRYVGTALDEREKFNNSMIDAGVTSSAQLDEAWGNFINSTNKVDPKTGNLDVESLHNWNQYFKANPQSLPQTLKKRMIMQHIISQEEGRQAASNNAPQAQQQAVQQQGGQLQQAAQQQTERPSYAAGTILQTGVVPKYTGQSPNQLLTGTE